MTTPCNIVSKTGENYSEFVCSTCGKDISLPCNVNYDDVYIQCSSDNAEHLPLDVAEMSYLNGDERVKFSDVLRVGESL